jgi:RHS repeat-associated protein
MGREIEELRTRRSRTFERADGSRVARVYQRSVHFRVGDGWEPIRNRLEREADGDLTNAANRYELSIPDRLAEGPLRLEHEDAWVTFELQGAQERAKARVEGSEVSFSQALPGVTARWTAGNDSVKEELVLAGAHAPASYRFDVEASGGLTLRERGDGGLEFVDVEGQVAFGVPAPIAFDASGAHAPADAVGFAVSGGAGSWVVELSVDESWVRAPGRVFPVTVDPTIDVPSEVGDCWIAGGEPSTSFCESDGLWVGWAYDDDHRSLLKFDVDAALPGGAVVTGAELWAYMAERSSGSAPKAVRVHRVLSAWDEQVTWLERTPGTPWASPGGDFASVIEASVTVGTSPGWFTWDVSDLVGGWVSGTLPNEGLMLKDDGTQTDGGLVFASSEAPPQNWPTLEIAYDPPIEAGPTHALTGGLREPLGAARDLAVTASDSAQGVRSLGIWLDPDLDPSPGEADEFTDDLCTSSCPGSLGEAFSLPTGAGEGRHTILVRSEDGAGNVTKERFHVHVSALRRVDRSRLGLEEWFQYDQTPTGGDSNLYVNADTGNVVWHSTPIVNPGRGLSTVVNLTYNAHDQGGLLGRALARSPIVNVGPESLGERALAALSYAEAGNGVSISVSGPSRVNEPLRGVLLAAAAEEGTLIEGVSVPSTAEGLQIALTDADGTEHVFTNVAGQWVAPPGLNMRLRRYRDGGSLTAPVEDKWALTRPDGVTHFFDTFGFQTNTKDRNANTLTYVYERINAFDGLACASTDILGRLVGGATPRLCVKRLTSVVDPAGRSLEIDYLPGGFLDGQIADMTADLPLLYPAAVGGRAGRIDSITDHKGREYDLSYDGDGYLVRLDEAAGEDDVRATRLSYEAPMEGLAQVGDDRQLRTVSELEDENGNGEILDGEVRAETTVWYGESGVTSLPGPTEVRMARRAEHIIERNDTTKDFTYTPGSPARFEVSEDIFPDQTTTAVHEIDARGRPVSFTNEIGNETTLAWNDAENKLSRMTRAAGTADESATDYAYASNGTGVLEAQTSYPSWPATTGARTTDLTWQFGAGQHLSTATGVSDSGGGLVADLVELENPKPGTGWQFTVDTRGNVTAREDAAGNVAETEYDSVGRITLERDEHDNEVEYHDFHATGQPGRVVDERENPWFYTYDAVGNVTAVVDPRGRSNPSGAEGNPFTTTLSYDSFDRMVREHIPKLSNAATPIFITRTRTFDRNGNVISSVDGRGQETEISYMRMDQPLEVSAPGSAGPEITQYVYDMGERLIGVISPKGHGLTTDNDVTETHAEECASEDPPLDFLTRYCLDDIGRVQAEIRYSTRSGDPSSLMTTYAYDRRDNVVGMVDPNRNAGRTAGAAISAAANPSLQRMAYEYNKVDELTVDTEKPTEAGASPTVWRFFYDANGNQVEVRHPRGEHIRTHLTYDHRDQLIASNDPLGHLSCLQRRADGRVIAETTPRGTAGNHSNCTDGNALTGYTHYTTRYDYDKAGNLLSRSIPFAPNQYGRTDAQLVQWKVEYTHDEVGDPIAIEDARNNSFVNTFFDTGDLRTTNRPSWWRVSGGAIAERMGRSTNAAKSDQQQTPDSTLGETDFGKVDPEPLPDLLPQAGHTELGYDGEMNLTSVVDARDKARTLSYDPAGRLETQVWPFKTDGITHAFDYDKNGNVVDFFDGLQHTTYAYDGYDRLAEETAPGAREEVGGPLFDEVTRFRYDHNDNQRFVETPRGVATAPAGDFTFETAYDSLDRVAFEEAPDGGRTSFAYDVASNLTVETHPRGQGRTGEDLESFQTLMNYDEADRLKTSRQQVMDGDDLGELVTSMDYDADDNLTSVTEPGAQAREVTTRVFEGRGLPWKMTQGTSGAARTRIVEYDPNGNLRRRVNPRGIDGNGDVRVKDTGEDSNENLVNASKNATVFKYGDNDLLLTRRMPWNDENAQNERKFRTVFQRNDLLSRITSILSAHEVTDEGQVDDNKVPRTSYEYFDTDWIASISDQKLSDPSSDVIFQNRRIEFDYDKRGAQTKWKSRNAGEDAPGRHIVREFFPNGQLQSRTAEKTTPDAAETSRTYRYFYNRNRSLSAFKDERNNRLTTISRDPVERQSEVNETWANGKDSRFTYDLAGNVETRLTDGKTQLDGSFGGDDRKTTTFEYDSLDREFRMTVNPMVGADRVTVTNYWPSGRRQSRRKPNGTSERWFFDNRGAVTRFERQREGQTGLAREVDYEYDDNANRSKDERGTYVFNARDQLVKWTKGNGQVTEYVLNGDGAMTRKTIDPPSGSDVVTIIRYRGERLRWTETNDVRDYYRYDAFGNVTRIIRKGATLPEENDEDLPRDSRCPEVPTDIDDNETYYCYDEFERPRLSRGAGIDEVELIDHDGLDRRDMRRVAAMSKTRDFSYIGTSELLSREVDDDGAKRFYDYDSMGDRLGQQVTKGADNRFRAYTKDVNDSVLGLESDDGQVLAGADYDYDPYGELENPGGLNPEAQENPFRFEGFYYDSGVKTYDMFARPYRPEIGRFLTQDRYASASQDLLLQSDPLTQNRYAFAGGNPVNTIEFDGHYKGNEGAAQRAMKGSRTPRGKRRATKAEEFIPGASKSAGIAPASFNSKPSGEAPLTDASSTRSDYRTPVLAPPPKRPDSCPVAKTGPAAGSPLTCEHGIPRHPRTQYECVGNTQTPEGEPACAAWKLHDPALINTSVQETFAGGYIIRGGVWVLGKACARWCDDVGRAVVSNAGRLCNPGKWCEKVTGVARGAVNRVRPGAAKARIRDPEPQFLPDGTPNRGPAAWVNTMDDSGKITTHASSPGVHAEVNAHAAAPGAPMSRVWGWRGPKNAPVWQEIPICAACQAKLPRSQFPPDVKADPGPWGRP